MPQIKEIQQRDAKNDSSLKAFGKLKHIILSSNDISVVTPSRYYHRLCGILVGGCEYMTQ